MVGVNATLWRTHSLAGLDVFFFVALFFAVENAEKRCAVWAIDLDWVIRIAKSLKENDFKILRDEDPYLKSGYFFELVFHKRPPIPLVYSLNPNRLN